MTRGTQPGFSLIEVLIVMLILTVVVLGTAGIFVYGFESLSKTKQVSLATQAAQLELERFRNTAFDTITDGSVTAPFTRADFPSLFREGDGGAPYLRNGQRTITIQPGADPDIKRLTITITWDLRGREMRKDVVTYIARDGINRK